MKRIGLLGANPLSLVVAEILRAQTPGVDLFYFDDDPDKQNKELCGIKVYGPASEIKIAVEKNDIEALVICLGDKWLSKRKFFFETCENLGLKTPVVRHPTVVSFESTSIAPGNLLGPGVLIGRGVRLEPNSVFWAGAVIEHDCVISHSCYIGPNVTLSGFVTIGECSMIGSAAVVLPEISIGSHCVVGAGAVVTRDVPDDSTVAGVPARPIHVNQR